MFSVKAVEGHKELVRIELSEGKAVVIRNNSVQKMYGVFDSDGKIVISLSATIKFNSNESTNKDGLMPELYATKKVAQMTADYLNAGNVDRIFKF